jgi:hypothetical protein
MPKYLFVLLSLLLIPAFGLVRAEAPLRVEVDLADGSHLLGTPGITSVLLQTPYARLNLPLAQLGCLQLGADRETVACSLQNGDKLSGVLTLAPFKLQTLFGPVTIGLEQLHALRVANTNLWADEALVGYWRLDGDAKDAKGVRHGVWRGRACYDGRRASGAAAALFDGNTSSVQVQNSVPLGCQQSFTLSAWVSVQGINPPARYGGLLSMSAREMHRFGASLSVDGDREGRIKFSAGRSGVGEDQVFAREPPRVNEWHHYAGVYDTRAVTLYVDGVLQGSTPYTYGDLPPPAGPLVMGPESSVEWQQLQAAIAEVAVWSRALSAAEVAAVYRADK